MYSVNSVTFNFCKLFFCHDSIENDAGNNAFKVVPLPAAKQRIFKQDIRNLFALCSCCQLISLSILVKPHDSTANGCKMMVH